jgi:DNA repair exonuclease SbcCD nuclease subunit
MPTELIGGATRQALVTIVDLCIDEQVDALIIAGDLYEDGHTSKKTTRLPNTRTLLRQGSL